MEAYIDRELFQEPPPEQPPGRSGFFPKTLVISLFLHGLALLLIFALPGGKNSSPTVTFIDLTVADPAPATLPVPPVETAPIPSSVPDTEPAEQSLPATEPQAPPETVAPTKIPDPATAALSLGLGRGYFTSISRGETLRDDIREYYFQLLQKINRKWWETDAADRDKMKRDMIVEITINREGAITDLQIIQGSGNQWADSRAKRTLKEAGPLPPLPSAYPYKTFSAPMKLVGPGLLSIQNLL